VATQLARDLDRRRLLAGLATGAGAMVLAGCGSRAARAAAEAACPITPSEIRGPFPADGVGGRDRAINVLASEDIVRSDIRSSFAGMTGTTPGVPLRLELELVAGEGCAPLDARAIYLWQCDARGDYSLYNRRDANWLRGLQATDGAGRVRFASIVPGCYGGRAPHLHLEVFASTQAALGGEPALLVSQLGLPQEPCAAVYADRATYGESADNLERWPPTRDWAFRGEERAMLMLAMSGEPAGGYSGEARITLGA
jgi:protocatechuate 3,4-dioxygenase beta subunit